MAKTPEQRYGTKVQGWIRISVALLIIIQPIFQLANNGFNWPSALLLTVGTALIIYDGVRLILLGRARKGTQQSTATTDQADGTATDRT